MEEQAFSRYKLVNIHTNEQLLAQSNKDLLPNLLLLTQAMHFILFYLFFLEEGMAISLSCFSFVLIVPFLFFLFFVFFFCFSFLC